MRVDASAAACATTRRYHRAGLPGGARAGWVREGVAEALGAGPPRALPDGLTLVVWDGYRSLETQAALYDGYLAELTMVHPDQPADALEEAAARYVTPPSRSPAGPAAAPHRRRRQPDPRRRRRPPLDLGTDFDAFVPEAGARALEDARRPGPRPAPPALLDHGRGRASPRTSRSGGTSTSATSSWGLVRGMPARYAGADGPA